MKPYGYVRKDGEGLFIYGENQFQNAMDAELVPVYLHPKEWVGLTDREMMDAIYIDDTPMEMGRKIEQALKEKNT
jgi:hypothetical protein